MTSRFVWNSNKAAANIRKHRVSFTEAASVFKDVLAQIFDDDEHSDEEIRELIVGYSDKNRLLIVSFTERADSVRLISARLAVRKERTIYEAQRR